MMTLSQLAKLPKFAQDEIKRLESNAEYYKEQLRQVTEAGASPVSWSQGIDNEHGIPHHATVKFQTPSGYIDVHLHLGGSRLEIRAQSTLVIIPEANNAANVYTTHSFPFEKYGETDLNKKEQSK